MGDSGLRLKSEGERSSPQRLGISPARGGRDGRPRPHLATACARWAGCTCQSLPRSRTAHWATGSRSLAQEAFASSLRRSRASSGLTSQKSLRDAFPPRIGDQLAQLPVIERVESGFDPAIAEITRRRHQELVRLRLNSGSTPIPSMQAHRCSAFGDEVSASFINDSAPTRTAREDAVGDLLAPNGSEGSAGHHFGRRLRPTRSSTAPDTDDRLAAHTAADQPSEHSADFTAGRAPPKSPTASSLAVRVGAVVDK